MPSPTGTPSPSIAPAAAATIESLVDAIPHPIVIGCAAIGLGLIIAGFASPVKSRSDRVRNSKTAERRRKGTRLRWLFGAMLLLAGILTAAGTGLTINGGRIDADKKAAETREENERARGELDRQFRTVLAALNAAKQEQTAALTEQRLKAIGNDVTQWAQEFALQLPDKERQFDEARTAERQREIQLCSDSAPLFNFTISFVERAARAYAAQSGAHIEIHLPPLPQNYFDTDANVPRYVKFGEKSDWGFRVIVSAPVNQQNPPQLYVSLSGPRGRGGNLWISRSADGKKFSFGGGGLLPVADGPKLFHEYDMEGFEQTIDSLCRHFLEAQLIESKYDTPTPTPTTSP